VSGHVLGNDCLRHLDSNLQQFPGNVRSSPAPFGETHVIERTENFRMYRWVTIATPILPSPRGEIPSGTTRFLHRYLLLDSRAFLRTIYHGVARYSVGFVQKLFRNFCAAILTR
jgi:hypothetical protein